MIAGWHSFRRLLSGFGSPGAEKSAKTGLPRTSAPASSGSLVNSTTESSTANYDSLTGLPLTELFLQHVQVLIESARRRGASTAVVEIGLSDVKRIGDTFGPRFGDLLIRQAGLRLYSALKPNDVLGRVGRVNFAIGLEPFDSLEDSLNVAQRFLAILDETFSLIELSEHKVRLSANAGISLFPTHGDAAEDLLYKASLALSQAGNSPANRVEVFCPERREESKLRLMMEWMMRHALEQGEFDLFYQPEFDLHTRRIVRREALLRWNRAAGGPYPPSAFIPVAEQTGLIVPLGNWVLGEACRRAREWQDEDSGVGVAVNVSPVQLDQPEFASAVKSALAEAGLAPELLELELTESTIMADFARSLSEIRELRDLGVSVVIDDFGVGYSSLTYLKELPVTGVKLDRSFLRDLQRNQNTIPILRSIVSLAHGLGVRVIVEGVETEQELEEVRRLGVDTVQGFLLGRPETRQLPDNKAARKGA
jgi:diguanylate cyclase (GGDEF)-like protein